LNGEVQEFSFSLEDTTVFNGTISNFASCTGSFVFSVIPGRGLGSVKVQVGKYQQVLFSQVTNGVTPVFMSCEGLRTLAGANWTGSLTVTIEIVQRSTHSLTLLFPSDHTRLPITKYYPGIASHIECHGVRINCTKGCPITISPTVDPLFSFWSSAILNVVSDDYTIYPYPVLEKTVSTLVWITELAPNNRVGSLLFGLGEQVLDDNSFFSPDCKIVYSQLVDELGDSVNFEATAVSPQIETCYPDSYDRVYSMFQNIITTLNNNTKQLSTTSSLAFIDLATTVANSVAWQNCKKLALSYLDDSSTSFTEYTTDCFYPAGSKAWTSDPCCNQVLQLTQCCATRDYSFNFTKYAYPHDDSEFDECKYPACLIQPLHNLVEITAYASQASCSDTRNQVTSDEQFVGTPWSACQLKIFGASCSTDSSCKSFHPNSICIRTSSTCTIPCTGSCYFGECAMESSYGLVCPAINSTITEEAQEKAFYKCISENLEQYLAISLIQQVQQQSPNKDTPIDKMFIDLIKQPSCVSEHGKLQSVCSL